MGDVSQLRARLASPDEETRRQVVMSLRDRSDGETLSVLCEALGDKSWRVRKAAAGVLRNFPRPREVVRDMIESLADPDNAGLRSGAVEVLTSIGREASPQLLENVHHPDADVRKFVVDILGEIKDERAVDSITGLTTDAAEVIRLAAVEALGSIGGERSFNSLLGLLATDDVSMQFSLLHALGRMNRPIPFESIRPLMGSKILRRALFDALGQTRSPEAIEFIAAGLKDPAAGSRQAAVRALAQVAADPGALELARQAVKKQLAGAPLAPLAEYLSGPHAPTKRATVTLMSLIGTAEAAEALMRAASDDSIAVEVAEALARIKSSAPEVAAKVESAPVADEKVKEVLFEARPRPRAAAGPMDNQQFNFIRDMVASESGLYYDRELKYLVERRVQRRMEDLHQSGYEEYFRLLSAAGDAGAVERRKLISLLSTNETYFFREDFQLKCFTEEIVPALRKRKGKKGSKIRVWSAGCSSGEEPYTIAMLLSESGALGAGGAEILASDISENMIAKARSGLYTEASFRTTPATYLNKYFKKEGTRWQLADEIRKMVTFDNSNLITCGSVQRLQGLDVIFCRNVIIYFGPEAKRKVVEQFHDLLNPGGFLLLGHSESLMNVSNSFELVHMKNDLVYRKPEAKP